MKANKEVKPQLKRGLAFAAGACMSFAAFPAFAYANEPAQGGASVLLPNMAEFLPMLVAFLILSFVLGKFGWPAFNAMLEKREETIRTSLEKSEAARIESEKILEEYKEQLAQARMQATQIIADAKNAGERARADIALQAQQEADRMIEQARVAIEAEKRAAVNELRSSMVDTTVDIASRVIGEDLSDDEHRAIIERYVQEAGSFNGN